MVKPLTFKGEKPKTKKRKHREHSPSSSSAPTKALKPTTTPTDEGNANDEKNAEDQTWVSADAPSDISGPILLLLPSSTPTCIATDMHGKVFASELENLIDGDARTAEPHDVRQVWIATRVAGTEGFSLKSCYGKYLSCDKYGIFSASASAVSAAELFLIHSDLEVGGEGAFFVRTMGGDTEGDLFLGIREKEGKGGGGAVEVEVRGDETTRSFSTVVRVRMQARFKPRIKASKENRAREKISRKELEEAVGRRLEEHEVKRLRRARREGNFHEEVLDVRVKGKHDKFAW